MIKYKEFDMACGYYDLNDYILNNKSNSIIINTLNPHSYVVSKNDHHFYLSLLRSDLLVCDGIGLYLLTLLKYRKKIKRITGYDLFTYLLEQPKFSGLPVVFLGSTDETLASIYNKFSSEYPNRDVYTYSPPFKNDFDQNDIDHMIEFINSIGNCLLFVGLTAPKQEKLIDILREKTEFSCAAGIGAVFDYYAGNIKRPPAVIRRMGLEWVYRLIFSKSNIAERVFVSTPKFIFYTFFR